VHSTHHSGRHLTAASIRHIFHGDPDGQLTPSQKVIVKDKCLVGLPAPCYGNRKAGAGGKKKDFFRLLVYLEIWKREKTVLMNNIMNGVRVDLPPRTRWGPPLPGTRWGPDPCPHARHRARRAALATVVEPRRRGWGKGRGAAVGGARRAAGVVGGRGRRGWCVCVCERSDREASVARRSARLREREERMRVRMSD
jgi:hypothetical protein